MKRNALILSAMIAAAVCGGAIGQDTAPPQDPVVVAQDLQKLRAAGQFTAVLWTRRTTLCTMQVVLGGPQDGSRQVKTDLSATYVKPPPLEIEMWLLRADGTKMPATGRWQSRNFNSNGFLIRSSAPEVLFAFPLSAATEAVTAVMTVNGKVYVEPLQPFKDRAN